MLNFIKKRMTLAHSNRMKRQQNLSINFIYSFLLIVLISHVDSRAMAGQINASVFGPVDDFIKILSRNGDHLVSVTLSESRECINVLALVVLPIRFCTR